MNNVAIYIQGQKLNLFNDERIEYVMNVKDLSDISKIFSDFSQTFTVPADPVNNAIFTHWYDADIDGTFNANLRIDGYIEVDTIPFKFGSVQMIEAKRKKLKPYAYVIQFFADVVNLSDKFGDDELSLLDLSEFDHPYNSSNVIDAMRLPVIGNGEVYYPFINANQSMSIGSGQDDDLLLDDNLISYRDFKPAIRMYHIVKAIQARYGVTFTDDFFDRAVFYNRFFWLHREAGSLKAYGQPLVVDIQNTGDMAAIGFTVNTATDTITYSSTSSVRRYVRVKIIPDAGYTTIPYIVDVYDDGELKSSTECVGTKEVQYGERGNRIIQFKVRAGEDFNFDSRVKGIRKQSGIISTAIVNGADQSASGYLYIKDQMPQMKIKDFISSLISEYNLILRPISKNTFLVDTLDAWYSKGKAYDITRLVDIADTNVKRPDIKKTISFLYQKAGAILGLRYFTNNNIGYGDLSAKFDTAGSDLKVESKFENMLFERLQNETEGDLTDIQAGYAIDAELKPYKGAPFTFFRNGYTDSENDLYIQTSGGNPPAAITRIWHTATEDNVDEDQVTASLNFGSDISSYFYSPIERSMFFNWWKTFIDDLYNRKNRIYPIKLNLPSRILYGLQLNDRFVFGDRKYKFTNLKVGLTDNQATCDLFVDFGPPVDSVDLVIPLTVDSTEYTVDTEALTVDMISIHDPVTSYTDNGIDRSEYNATSSQEYFEIKVSANTVWNVTKISTGFGVNWFGYNITGGKKTTYVRCFVNRNTGAYRSGTIRFSIGGTNYDLSIEQDAA